MFRIIKKIAERRQYFKIIFDRAKIFLDKGVYYIPYNKKEIKKVDKNIFFIKNLIRFRLFWNKKSGGGIKHPKSDSYIPVNNVEIDSGLCKHIIMTQDRVFGFYDTEERYFNAKNKYEHNYHNFNYSCVGNIFFNDELRCIVMDRIYGSVYNDKYHNNLIIKKLLEWEIGSETKIDPEGKVLFLQHGDAKYQNIIWIENSFIFIDLDVIGYFPPLFDVIHYLCGVYNDLSDIIAVLKENEEAVKKICQLSKIDVYGNYLDEIIYRYVSLHIKWNVFSNNYKFLTSKNTLELPKTNELLNSLNN